MTDPQTIEGEVITIKNSTTLPLVDYSRGSREIIGEVVLQKDGSCQMVISEDAADRLGITNLQPGEYSLGFNRN